MTTRKNAVAPFASGTVQFIPLNRLKCRRPRDRYPDTLIVDGHGLSWRRLVLLRGQQVEAFSAGQSSQLSLFIPYEDHRPPGERAALRSLYATELA